MPWSMIGPELFPLVIFLISFGIEPRKFRTGVYLLVGLGWLAVLLLVGLMSVALQLGSDSGAQLLIALLVVSGLTVAGLGVFLVIAGITLVRREGFNPRRLLSVVVGLVLLGFLAGIVVVAVSRNTKLFAWLAVLGIPASYLGFGFAAFVIYGAFYPAWMAKFGAPAGAVVVLGAGLIDGRVPPLLASRLRKGRAVFDRAKAAGRPVKMITSGGKGPDEPVAEAVAMRDFLLADGMDPQDVLTEDRSRNTAQNLAFTAEILRAATLPGPVAVVTSDFHALRAAFLMRSAKIDGYAVGARTAVYYWPTAVIREYVAVLRDHLWLNAILVALSSVPLGLAILQAITSRLR